MRFPLASVAAAAALSLLSRPAEAQWARTTPDTTAQVRLAGDTLSVVHWVEAKHAQSQQLLVHNRTGDSLRVTQYRISRCTGVLLPECRAHAVGRVVPPHATLLLGEIRLRPRTGAVRYHYAIALADPLTGRTLSLRGQAGS